MDAALDRDVLLGRVRRIREVVEHRPRLVFGRADRAGDRRLGLAGLSRLSLTRSTIPAERSAGPHSARSRSARPAASPCGCGASATASADRTSARALSYTRTRCASSSRCSPRVGAPSFAPLSLPPRSRWTRNCGCSARSSRRRTIGPRAASPCAVNHVDHGADPQRRKSDGRTRRPRHLILRPRGRCSGRAQKVRWSSKGVLFHKLDTFHRPRRMLLLPREGESDASRTRLHQDSRPPAHCLCMLFTR